MTTPRKPIMEPDTHEHSEGGSPAPRETRPAANNPDAVVTLRPEDTPQADGAAPPPAHPGTDQPQACTLASSGAPALPYAPALPAPPAHPGTTQPQPNAPAPSEAPALPAPIADTPPLAPARCTPPPVPTLPDGTVDLPALAEHIRHEIEDERKAIWRLTLEKDKGRTLDPDHLLPPDTPALWTAERPKPQARPRPTLHEMHQYCSRNQLGDAELLQLCCNDSMIFDHKRARWLTYDGIRWVEHEVGDSLKEAMTIADLYEGAAAEQLAKRGEDIAQAREAERCKWLESPDSEEAKRAEYEAELRAKKSNSEKIKTLRDRARSIRDAGRAKKVLEIASSGVGSLGVSGKTWDQYPTLMACANGVIDLTTGGLTPASPDMMLRKTSPYPYLGLHLHSTFWEDHLRKVFCGDAALIDYFERVIGYAATGLISHKELYCAYGPTSNNGKSQTFNAIAEAMGQYAGTFKVTVLLEDGQKTAGPDPDFLVLDGLRMAITSEPKRGAKFSAEMLKAVTGDDIIRARGLYSDPIEFKAICKLFLHTNFIPQLRSADRAFERRLRVIPFEAMFTMNPDEEDPARHIYAGLPADVLKRNMAESGPAVLSWIVRCARRFLRDRDLTPPPIVQQWTKEYAEEQDLVGEFIAFCCHTGDSLRVQAKDMYAAFTKFCQQEKSIPDNRIMSLRAFGDDMKQRFKKHSSNKVFYLGVAPRPEWMPDGGQGSLD